MKKLYKHIIVIDRASGQKVALRSMKLFSHARHIFINEAVPSVSPKTIQMPKAQIAEQVAEANETSMTGEPEVKEPTVAKTQTVETPPPAAPEAPAAETPGPSVAALDPLRDSPEMRKARFDELEKVGYKNLKGLERAEYSVLKKEFKPE